MVSRGKELYSEIVHKYSTYLSDWGGGECFILIERQKRQIMLKTNIRRTLLSGLWLMIAYLDFERSVEKKFISEWVISLKAAFM